MLDPARAILSTGFPSYRDYGQAALLKFVGSVQQFKKVRQVGAAAISLAWVACGRIDAYGEDPPATATPPRRRGKPAEGADGH